MQKLHSKPCSVCGTPVFGVKRRDRNAFNYNKRCESCRGVWTDAAKKKLIKTASQKEFLPIGSRQLHKASDGFYYWKVKIAQPGKWEYEHRVIKSTELGRPLLREEHVHHDNEDTLDNSPLNLIVKLNGDHVREHHELKGKWSERFECCTECETTTKKHIALGLCSTCYQRHRFNQLGYWRKP